ncbi:phosphoribosyltransferase-like protein [Alloalcanivorax xenomutans]|uniref:phosphoribosyltransferase-like protein n=1 Tax=Alloalcanivorax xenomutans TaxID=1094342 RepID=UPI003C5B5781
MNIEESESKIRILINHAWDREVDWPAIEQWLGNFDGYIHDADSEKSHCLLALSRFMYFGKRLVREMLKSLYRDHIRAPMRQRIRRNFDDTRNIDLIDAAYEQELSSTRFIGVGNPSESGAHLLYYFRQVNALPKDLFSDLASIISTSVKNGDVAIRVKGSGIRRLVFFDDLVGSGDQVTGYLAEHLRRIKKTDPDIDVRFMSLFATEEGLEKLNRPTMFDGNAFSLFELDESYKAFSNESRYFFGAPEWFSKDIMRDIARGYGIRLLPSSPLGHRNNQLLIGFSHNTPDNVPPIFWADRLDLPWYPAFLRYHKNYG